MMQHLWISKEQHLRGCIIQMFAGHFAGHFARDCPNQDPQPMKALGRLHHTLEAEAPISRSLLNEFFNKLMQSERKQEIAKAKLKKARQQVNAQANLPQAQVVGCPYYSTHTDSTHTCCICCGHSPNCECATEGTSGKTNEGQKISKIKAIFRDFPYKRATTDKTSHTSQL